MGTDPHRVGRVAALPPALCAFRGREAIGTLEAGVAAAEQEARRTVRGLGHRPPCTEPLGEEIMSHLGSAKSRHTRRDRPVRCASLQSRRVLSGNPQPEVSANAGQRCEVRAVCAVLLRLRLGESERRIARDFT